MKKFLFQNDPNSLFALNYDVTDNVTSSTLTLNISKRLVLSENASEFEEDTIIYPEVRQQN